MNVIALPHRVRDKRIVLLAAKFGVEKPFTVFQAADLLGISPQAAYQILAYDPIADDVYRVSGINFDFWLLTQPPEKIALDHWQTRYVPILRRLGSKFNATQFASAASIPLPSANFLLSQFVKAGIVEATLIEGMVTYTLKQRRKVNFRRKVRVRGVVYQGY